MLQLGYGMKPAACWCDWPQGERAVLSFCCHRCIQTLLGCPNLGACRMDRALPSLSSLCLIHVLHYSPFTGFGSCVVGGWDKLAHGCYGRNISPFQGCGDGQYLRTAAVSGIQWECVAGIGRINKECWRGREEDVCLFPRTNSETCIDTPGNSDFCPFCVSALCPGPNSHKKCRH